MIRMPCAGRRARPECISLANNFQALAWNRTTVQNAHYQSGAHQVQSFNPRLDLGLARLGIWDYPYASLPSELTDTICLKCMFVKAPDVVGIGGIGTFSTPS